MKTILTAGTALAALAVTAGGFTATASAADLGGSIKDGYVQPMPEIIRGGAGPCYFRADIGYSFAKSPDITWPVNQETRTGHDDGSGTFVETAPRTYTHITDEVTATDRESGIFGEVGAGCGSGSRGIRGEVMFGYHGDRKVEGEPGLYTIHYQDDGFGQPLPPDQPVDDPMHTSVRSYTMMLNVYKDFGRFGMITPYVGAGIGAAYHMVDETYFTGNYYLPARIHGDNDLSFAWSLMAGIGYQVSDRAILDVGYRYIDMGEATSERSDTAGYVNPRVNIDDLAAHEIKIGLRYHFGGESCCEYAPMK